MFDTLRLESTVLPGNRLELQSPSLPEGQKVEVIVMLSRDPKGHFDSALEFLESLPASSRDRAGWAEYERELEEEREAWDR